MKSHSEDLTFGASEYMDIQIFITLLLFIVDYPSFITTEMKIAHREAEAEALVHARWKREAEPAVVKWWFSKREAEAEPVHARWKRDADPAVRDASPEPLRFVKKEAEPEPLRFVKKEAEPEPLRFVKREAEPLRFVKKEAEPEPLRFVKRDASPEPLRFV
ncbi:hypothetical protein HDV06_007008 [Boothiomyces sp. JEL0866]|nr:hypothetical protein HDV06_007008 [Boothiomyces sp. JEL0866]